MLESRCVSTVSYVRITLHYYTGYRPALFTLSVRILQHKTNIYIYIRVYILSHSSVLQQSLLRGLRVTFNTVLRNSFIKT
jgi:hypothetical protein